MDMHHTGFEIYHHLTMTTTVNKTSSPPPKTPLLALLFITSSLKLPVPKVDARQKWKISISYTCPVLSQTIHWYTE